MGEALRFGTHKADTTTEHMKGALLRAAVIIGRGAFAQARIDVPVDADPVVAGMPPIGRDHSEAHLLA